MGVCMVGGGSVYEGMRELECSKLVRAATPTFVEPVRATTKLPPVGSAGTLQERCS